MFYGFFSDIFIGVMKVELFNFKEWLSWEIEFIYKLKVINFLLIVYRLEVYVVVMKIMFYWYVVYMLLV